MLLPIPINDGGMLVTDHETQDEINQAEWGNSDNWSTLYFSKKDSRSWVPKRNPQQGWTINFGDSSGARWIYYFFGIFFLVGSVLGMLFSYILMKLFNN